MEHLTVLKKLHIKDNTKNQNRIMFVFNIKFNYHKITPVLLTSIILKYDTEHQHKNGIRDACSTADIINCLQMALSLELFEYCSVCSD